MPPSPPSTIAATEAVVARAAALGLACTGADVVLPNIFAGDVYRLLQNTLQRIDEEECTTTVANLVQAHDLLEPSLSNACRVQYECICISRASMDRLEDAPESLQHETRLFYMKKHEEIESYVALLRNTLSDVETCLWYLDQSEVPLGEDFERVMCKIKAHS